MYVCMCECLHIGVNVHRAIMVKLVCVLANGYAVKYGLVFFSDSVCVLHLVTYVIIKGNKTEQLRVPEISKIF